MQLNRSSLFLLKKISAKQRAKQRTDDAASQSDAAPESKSAPRRQRLQNWLSPKPAAIQAFPGEKELFRKSLILATDTRLAYIDPFDNVLKTYMFEHMVSVHKQFYRPTVFNRRLCSGVLILSIAVLLITFIIDLLDSSSQGLFLVYIPLFASILLSLKVWIDMKPRYVLHWRMKDHTYGEIVQQPMLRERLKGDIGREVFMNELANAMNQALSTRAKWPKTRPDMRPKTQSETQSETARREYSDDEQKPTDRDNADEHQREGFKKNSSAKLELITENYQ